jgi:hypothetical protein
MDSLDCRNFSMNLCRIPASSLNYLQILFGSKKMVPPKFPWICFICLNTYTVAELV